MKKLTKKNTLISLIIAGALAIGAGVTGAIVSLNIGEGKIETKIEAKIEYSEEKVPAVVEDDLGEIIEVNEVGGEEIPTVEEVDGGLFEDKDTGVSLTEGMYADLGWSEWYDTSTPDAFMNDTLGKCVYGNNIYGAQCVSLSRVYWWSYADRDVSTCGTGMAKGMMNCSEQNAGNDFLVFWGSEGIQAGDWVVFDGGQYGHIGMALGPVKNGYVALLGENQGGKPCEGGGAATNIINISVKNAIGYYRPKAYIKPEPKPEPMPIAPDTGVVK